MLNAEIYDPGAIEHAAEAFHRDGFVCVRDPLSAEQFKTVRLDAEGVMQEQEDECGRDNMNRGYARHSFGNQADNWAWCMLIDLPTILPIIDAIWKDDDYVCWGVGGDYSLPGAQIQNLHRDANEDFFRNPWGKVTHADVPAICIVVDFYDGGFHRRE